MAKKITRSVTKSKAPAQKPAARSTPLIASSDVKNSQQFCQVMSALMSDALTGAIAPGPGNLACNAAGKMLKAIEMQMKYGPKGGGALQLT